VRRIAGPRYSGDIEITGHARLHDLVEIFAIFVTFVAFVAAAVGPSQSLWYER
jgi:hypothetical protein